MNMPPTNMTGAPPPGDGDLDCRREASMADEGGWSAALIETEEPCEPVSEPAPAAEPPPRDEASEPHAGGRRRLLSPVALGAAAAIAKLMSRARRYAARRAHSRARGH